MRDSVLDKSYVSLQKIRSYIVKLNYERRKTPIFDQKLNEAKAIYLEVKREVSSINQKIYNSELDDSEIRLVNELLVKINKLYDEILNFKDKQTEAAEMASFDLKVAVSLLPIMDDTENTTQKLIDAIELYDSMLNNEGKPLLIKFVLKTRLSNSAKLRLSTSYNSVNDLLGDIKKHFLTIKSDSALQLKLFRSKQGDKSIESFGKDLEELFVNLTISQAKGDENAYNVLKPINERNVTCDVMHDLCEGVHRYSMAVLIDNLIRKKYFTLDNLNARIRYFTYQISEKNVPPPVTKQHLLNGCIIFSASEMFDLIPDNEALWIYYLSLLEITQILTSQSITTSILQHLETLIDEHHQTFLALFNTSLKPKFHLLVHYVHIIEKIGPPIFISSFKDNLNIARNIEDRANCPNSVTDNHTGKKCFVNFDEEQHKIQTSSMVKELASTTENNEGLVPDLEDDQSINSDTDSRSSSKNPYSSDDSIRDPDYESSSSSSSSDSESENNNVGPGNMHNLEDTEADPQKKAKKRKSCPENWRKNILKRLRNSGKSYVSCGKKHQQVAERKKGPPCNDTKCRLKCSLKILGDIREAIFTDYWNLGDIEKQRCFLMANMEQINPKYRYVRDGSYRKPNHAFYFTVGGKKHRVCKLFFRTTLAMRGKHGKHTRVDEEIKDDVRNHIDSIPRKESHYSREGTSREFIDGGKSLADIHRDYVAISKAKERHYANYLMFSRIFNTEYNISFFIPKKDQCEDCIAYFNASEEDKVTLKEKYDTHLREKELSRQEKQNDKKNNDDNTIIAVYDLQAVLQCPRGDVSSFYYNSKLNVFNFSIYEMKTNTGRCFVWDDSEANRGVCEIGTCVFKYLQNLETYATEDKKLDVIFYSDNCCGQQKNRFMFGMYSYAVQNLSFINSITHKFLIKGHAQNEGGSMHSVIEKQIKKALKSGSIYVPQQYITLMRTTKKSGQPYIVTEVSYEDILNLKRSHYYRI
ncbi:unnamed protein product [Ceutorhynchus assimilis]|uniref:DUF7869 domain-containing protein n=1 Tax=Ceutorhynchus assimilis TaxID=467358 RepID=A0A9N9MEN8_9CUCU|nr:unnamed protein product [Ceutorhynchus assimilis]